MTEIKVHIWSNEHQSWWGKDSFGYTTKIERAGVYTLDEAIKIVEKANQFLDFAKGPHESIVPVPLDLED